MAPNIALLDRVIEQIEADPASWDQEYIARREKNSSCGSAYCVAGWAVVLSGSQIKWEYQNYGTVIYPTKTIYNEDIHDCAIRVLGVSTLDAWALFDAANTLEDIKDMRNQLAKHGKLLDELIEEKMTV